MNPEGGQAPTPPPVEAGKPAVENNTNAPQNAEQQQQPVDKLSDGSDLNALAEKFDTGGVDIDAEFKKFSGQGESAPNDPGSIVDGKVPNAPAEPGAQDKATPQVAEALNQEAQASGQTPDATNEGHDIDSQQARIDDMMNKKPDELQKLADEGNIHAKKALSDIQKQGEQAAMGAEDFLKQQAESAATTPPTENTPPQGESPYDARNDAIDGLDKLLGADNAATVAAFDKAYDKYLATKDVSDLAALAKDNPGAEALLTKLQSKDAEIKAIADAATARQGGQPDNGPIMGAKRNPDGSLDLSAAATVEFPDQAKTPAAEAASGNPPLVEATPEGVVAEAEQATREAAAPSETTENKADAEQTPEQKALQERKQMIEGTQSLAKLGIDINSEAGQKVLDLMAENPQYADAFKAAAEAAQSNKQIAGPEGAAAAAEATANALDDQIAKAEKDGNSAEVSRLGFIKKVLLALGKALLTVAVVAGGAALGAGAGAGAAVGTMTGNGIRS